MTRTIHFGVKKFLVLLALVGGMLVIFANTPVYGGNLQIIEKRIREMEKQNQRAIRQTAPVTKTDQIHLKAVGRKLHGNLWFDLHHLKMKPNPKGYPITLQISSDRDRAKSLEVARKLRGLGVPAYTAKTTIPKKGIWHRLFIGFYASKADAGATREAFAKQFTDALLVTLPFAVRVGTSDNPVYLERMTNHMESKGLLIYRVPHAQSPGTMRLLYGAYKTKTAAQPMIQSLRAMGIPASVVKR